MNRLLSATRSACLLAGVLLCSYGVRDDSLTLILFGAVAIGVHGATGPTPRKGK